MSSRDLRWTSRFAGKCRRVLRGQSCLSRPKGWNVGGVRSRRWPRRGSLGGTCRNGFVRQRCWKLSRTATGDLIDRKIVVAIIIIIVIIVIVVVEWRHGHKGFLLRSSTRRHKQPHNDEEREEHHHSG
jgi:hypothetical protein